MILYPKRVIKKCFLIGIGDVQTSDQLENLHQDYTYELKNPFLVMRDHWDITPRTLIKWKLSILSQREKIFFLQNLQINHGFFDSQVTK